MDDPIGINADDVLRMLRLVAPEVAREVSGAIKDVAEKGADMARANAAGEGFTPPGRSGRGKGLLIAEITSGHRGLVGYIKESANRDGFRYPAVFEFSREYKEGRMRRPFMVPVVQELLPYALQVTHDALEVALEKVTHV